MRHVDRIKSHSIRERFLLARVTSLVSFHRDSPRDSGYRIPPVESERGHFLFVPSLRRDRGRGPYDALTGMVTRSGVARYAASPFA